MNRIWRALVAGTLGVAVVATALVGAPVPAQAADPADFRPGDIISDAIFFDEDTMSEAAIQSFLVSKVPSCAVAYACLKSYKETTRNIAADPMCKSPYKAGTAETAARIIYKVAQACGVNPQVLIVTLQKEQGLVTSTNPSSRQYRSAMGYGCPDTAPCDAEYYGFFNQVYKSAWAFQRYTMPPGTGPGTQWYSVYSRYAAGKTATIQYHPNAGCGTSQVYIANKATGSLYFYTPYRPNAAALNAGYGVGDSCSAYGNRNFFNYFTDWFGSTHDPSSVAIAAKYAELGGANGVLGAKVGAEDCDIRAAGCWQGYANGVIYASPTTGAHHVMGAFRTKWGETGRENGVLGYPITDPKTGLADGGSYQKFETGAIYSSAASGVHYVDGPIRSAWGAQSFEKGALGYPTTDPKCGLVDGGCFQKYQGGSIYWTAGTGAVSVAPDVLAEWGSASYEKGIYGYPTARVKSTPGGSFQTFQGGTIVVASGTTTGVPGPLGVEYAKRGGPGGALGAPAGEQQCGSGGCWQEFAAGALTERAGVVRSMSIPIFERWVADGADASALGFPTMDTRSGLVDGGSYQKFSGGSIYHTAATGAQPIAGVLRTAWGEAQYERGRFGYPTSAAYAVTGGSAQDFEHGVLVSRSSGVVELVGAPYTAWVEAGGKTGDLGYPTGNQRTGLKDSGWWQGFQNGRIYSSATTGAHVLSGAVYTKWASQGWERGALGYPTRDVTCGLSGGGCFQHFQGGSIFDSDATPAAIVPTNLRTKWGASGWEKGPLGYPTRDGVCGLKDGGCFIHFQGGSIYRSASTPAAIVAGAIRTKWAEQGWERGPLGYPLADAATVSGKLSQKFQGGTLTAQ